MGTRGAVGLDLQLRAADLAGQSFTMRNGARSGARQADVEHVDPQGLHQMENLDLLFDRGILHRRRLKSVAQRFVVQQHFTGRHHRPGIDDIPVVDQLRYIGGHLEIHPHTGAGDTARALRHSRIFRLIRRQNFSALAGAGQCTATLTVACRRDYRAKAVIFPFFPAGSTLALRVWLFERSGHPFIANLRANLETPVTSNSARAQVRHACIHTFEITGPSHGKSEETKRAGRAL